MHKIESEDHCIISLKKEVLLNRDYSKSFWQKQGEIITSINLHYSAIKAKWFIRKIALHALEPLDGLYYLKLISSLNRT